MVMPDARGLVIRGLGSNAKIFKANNASYSGGTAIAQLLTDMMFGHRHGAAYNADDNYQTPTGAALQSVRQIYCGGSMFKDPSDDTVNGTPRTGDETRGASIGAQICITY